MLTGPTYRSLVTPAAASAPSIAVATVSATASESANARTLGPEPEIRTTERARVERGLLDLRERGHQRRPDRLHQRVADAPPQQCKITLMERGHQRRHVPEVGDRLTDGEPALRNQPARLGGQHLGMRMHEDDAQYIRHREGDQIERIRRTDEDYAAEHARRHVVRMRRP